MQIPLLLTNQVESGSLKPSHLLLVIKFVKRLIFSLPTLSLSMSCLLFSNEAKENDSKMNEHNINRFEFLQLLCYLLHTWMKNCMKDFHLCEEASPEFIFHSFVVVGEGIFLAIILFYSVHCFWPTASVPDFLTISHLASSLSPTYISLRTSCKQAGEFHSLGSWEYTWSCSHFRVDFSPITCISVIARCLVERAASALGISRPWGRSPRTPVVCYIFN